MKIKRIRYHRKKFFLGLFLFLFLLCLTFGYAFVTTKLLIDGVVRVNNSASWDIHFSNFNETSGSVEHVSNPVVYDTSVSFSAKLNNPGDFYEFTVNVVNDGTMNAILDSFSLTPDFSEVDYIDSTISYTNGSIVKPGDILKSGQTRTIKVNMTYKENLDEDIYPTTNQTYNVQMGFNYEQYTNKITTFENDSWDIIATNVANDPLSYAVGSTKTIKMDVNGDGVDEVYTLRVVNNTTPSECLQVGFSQTACGFVVEFQNVVATHRIGIYQNTSTPSLGINTKGGWEYTDMRAYLNGGIYLEGESGEIDYTGNGIFDKLPTNLSSNIIDTTVVTGHGMYDSENSVTTDKLYLLAYKEVSGSDSYDAAYNLTRQLDYYVGKDSTYRKKSNTRWWTRTFVKDNSRQVIDFNSSGADESQQLSDASTSAAPAFRIGKVE